MLRRELAAIVLVTLLADPAFADLQGASSTPPAFTQDETAVIERNEALSEIARSDPQLVRKLFDTLKQGRPDNTLPTGPSDGESANPDFGQMRRTSPEAAHDLFQLLKRAGERKNK